MKYAITAIITGILLCNAAPTFAQDSSQPATGAPSGQAAVDMLQSMPPEQRKQMIENGVDQVQDLTPEQLKQYKTMFDSLSPEQKQQLESQVEQQMQSDPKLKAKAEKKLENLTPAQQQQLEGEGQ